MEDIGMFPANDSEYREYKINSVERAGDSYAIGCDGWHLYCGDACPVEPLVGQTARQYGKGIGYPVRGLFVDGHKIWYRTESEEADYQEISIYGRDAADWLDRWDSDRGVWSITMGGLGPGYEQCIQITAAEVLRWYLEHKPDLTDDAAWKETRETLSRDVEGCHVIQRLGLSGAQWGAAMSLAAQLYRRGPRALMADEAVKDRRIQVSRSFPDGRP